MRASPSTMLERVTTALGHAWLAAFVNRARSSSLILIETERLRLGGIQPSSAIHPFYFKEYKELEELKVCYSLCRVRDS